MKAEAYPPFLARPVPDKLWETIDVIDMWQWISICKWLRSHNKVDYILPFASSCVFKDISD